VARRVARGAALRAQVNIDGRPRDVWVRALEAQRQVDHLLLFDCVVLATEAGRERTIEAGLGDGPEARAFCVWNTYSGRWDLEIRVTPTVNEEK
jgi:hypothetical protein